MPDQTSFAAALAALQADLPRIPRTATGQVQSRTYKYPPYDQIIRRVRPILHQHGFAWWTRPMLAHHPDGSMRFVLSYQLTHLPTGVMQGGDYPLTEGTPQAQGSQISYAKRYALVAVLDLEVVGEDDDAMPERTPAKIPGPEHERLRYGTVVGTPEDRPAERSHGPVDNSGDDPWAGQPAGEFDIGQPEGRPGSIDSRQLKAMHAAFGKLGIDDRAVRLGMTADIIGREVLTANQLSRLEADHLLKTLREKAGTP
jgi:ERF superfamily